MNKEIRIQVKDLMARRDAAGDRPDLELGVKD